MKAQIWSRYAMLASVALFTAGILVISYYLYTLPAEIAGALSITDPRQVSGVQDAMGSLNLIIGIEIAVGLAAIVLLLNTNGKPLHTLVAHAEYASVEAASTSQVMDDNASSGNALPERDATIEDVLNSSHPTLLIRLDRTLSKLCTVLEACQGAVYLVKADDNRQLLELSAGYAYYFSDSQTITYEFGEGLIGQVAKEGKLVHIQSVPPGYITILSGLGDALPSHLIIAPICLENTVVGVLEIASFKPFTSTGEELIRTVAEKLSGHLTGAPQMVQV